MCCDRDWRCGGKIWVNQHKRESTVNKIAITPPAPLNKNPYKLQILKYFFTMYCLRRLNIIGVAVVFMNITLARQ